MKSPGRVKSVRSSPGVWARVATRRSVASPPEFADELYNVVKGSEWSSSQRVWAAAQARRSAWSRQVAKESGAAHDRRGDPSLHIRRHAPQSVCRAGYHQTEGACRYIHHHPQRSIAADRRRAYLLQDAFRLADDVLHQGIPGISGLIAVPGLINLHLADVRAIMSEGGAALMGVWKGRGQRTGRRTSRMPSPASCSTSPSTAHPAYSST